jgi:predicted molibdopterin-dependent oxidoreductase YjgC
MITAERSVHTTCPYCGVGCQMDLHLQDGYIYRVSGRFDNEVNYGNLCVKGRFGYDFVHAPDRLEAPLTRASREAAFLPTSWEQALEHTSLRLQEIRDKHGPDSIAFLASAKCTNEENYLIQKLARGVVGTNNVDHCARL